MVLSGSGQGPVAGSEENDTEPSGSTTSGGFLDWVGDYWLLQPVNSSGDCSPRRTEFDPKVDKVSLSGTFHRCYTL